MRAPRLTTTRRYLRQVASKARDFERMVSRALDRRLIGDIDGARFWAAQARSDWRALQHLLEGSR